MLLSNQKSLAKPVLNYNEDCWVFWYFFYLFRHDRNFTLLQNIRATGSIAHFLLQFLTSITLHYSTFFKKDYGWPLKILMTMLFIPFYYIKDSVLHSNKNYWLKLGSVVLEEKTNKNCQFIYFYYYFLH